MVCKVCTDCGKEADCGEIVSGDFFCDNCIENGPYSRCESCNELVYIEEMIERDEGPDICFNCFDM